MYSFRKEMQSMRTGRTYAIGQIVPDEMLTPNSIPEMLRVGDIEEIMEVKEQEALEEPAYVTDAEIPFAESDPEPESEPVKVRRSRKHKEVQP
jgi:hypothetical protein